MPTNQKAAPQTAHQSESSAADLWLGFSFSFDSLPWSRQGMMGTAESRKEGREWEKEKG